MKLKGLIILGITVIGISISSSASAMGMIYLDSNFASRGRIVTFNTGRPTTPIMKEAAVERKTELGTVVAQVGADLSESTRSELEKALDQAAAGNQQATLEVLKAAVEVLSESVEAPVL